MNSTARHQMISHAPDTVLPVHRLFLDRRIFRFAVFATILFLLLSFFTPLQLQFAQEGLDPSWRLALVEARKQGLQFGSQVIFTGGPLSHVYSHIYDKSLTLEKFVAAAIFISFFAVIFRRVIFSSRNFLVACVAAMPFVFNLFDDPIFIGIPLAASLAIISARSRPERAALLLLGPVASATITLAKFSVFPMAIVGFLLTDVAALSQRRLPLGLIIYVLCLSVGFALTSPGASLLEFIQSSLDIAAGYAEAMGTWGPWEELVPVCTFAAGCLAAIVTFEVGSLRASSVSKTVSACRIACVGAYLYLCVKAGLVPHGVHQAILWYGISFAAAIYAALIVGSTSFAAAVTSSAASLSHRSLWILTAFVLAGLCGGQIWLAQQTGHANRYLLFWQTAQPYQRISQWIDFLRRPEEWLAAQEKISLEALRRVRDQNSVTAIGRHGRRNSIISVVGHCERAKIRSTAVRSGICCVHARANREKPRFYSQRSRTCLLADGARFESWPSPGSGGRCTVARFSLALCSDRHGRSFDRATPTGSANRHSAAPFPHRDRRIEFACNHGSSSTRRRIRKAGHTTYA